MLLRGQEVVKVDVDLRQLKLWDSLSIGVWLDVRDLCKLLQFYGKKLKIKELQSGVGSI
jgi:hypothetical protein